MKAINLETERQINCYNNNSIVNQETRNYNAVSNTTTILRSKEDAHDYRYFTEPDIPPIVITDEYIEDVKKDMPTLPKERFLKYKNEFKLSEYDSKILSEDKSLSDFFNTIILHTNNYKSAANLLMGVIKSYINERTIEISDLKISAEYLAELADMINDNKVNNLTVSTKIFPEMIKSNESPINIADKNGWIQEDNTKLIEELIEKAIKKYPDKVVAYQNGNSNLIGMFMGEIMRESKGKLNPKKINEVLKNKLSK